MVPMYTIVAEAAAVPADYIFETTIATAALALLIAFGALGRSASKVMGPRSRRDGPPPALLVAEALLVTIALALVGISLFVALVALARHEPLSRDGRLVVVRALSMATLLFATLAVLNRLVAAAPTNRSLKDAITDRRLTFAASAVTGILLASVSALSITTAVSFRRMFVGLLVVLVGGMAAWAFADALMRRQASGSFRRFLADLHRLGLVPATIDRPGLPGEPISGWIDPTNPGSPFFMTLDQARALAQAHEQSRFIVPGLGDLSLRVSAHFFTATVVDERHGICVGPPTPAPCRGLVAITRSAYLGQLRLTMDRADGRDRDDPPGRGQIFRSGQGRIEST